FLRLKNTDRVYQVKRIDGISFGNDGLVVINFLPVEANDFILNLRNAPAYPIPEIIDAVLIFQTDLIASVVDRSDVADRTRQVTHLRGEVHCTKDVGGTFLKHIYRQVEAVVKKSRIQTEVRDSGCFPGDVRIVVSGYGGTGCHVGAKR